MRQEQQTVATVVTVRDGSMGPPVKITSLEGHGKGRLVRHSLFYLSEKKSMDSDVDIEATGSDIWQRAEWLCRAVAGRELVGVPLYILPQSRMSLPLARSYHYAFTASLADLLFHDQIETWMGRGPCMVINDDGLKQDTHPQDLEYKTLTIIFHELAHILDRPCLVGIDHGNHERLEYERLVTMDCLSRPVSGDIAAYHGHDRSFIRIAIHLAYRATLAGYPIKAAGIFKGSTYGLSMAAEYEDALGSEPEESMHLKLTELKTLPCPSAFNSLWRADLNHYHQLEEKRKGVRP